MARRKAEHRKNEKPVKATQAEITQRVNKVFDLLLKGFSHADICRYASENAKWGVDERTVDRYIAAATADIKKRSEIRRDEELGKALEQLRFLYQQCVLVKDYKAALSIRKEISELMGLYPKKQVDITSGGERLVAPQIFLPEVEEDSRNEQ